MRLLTGVLLAALGGDAAQATKPVATDLLYGKVELWRDTWGTPHIFAATDAGALYGLGFATAQDRGFQMHYQLRLIQGRAAEVLGPIPHLRRRDETALTHDRRMRSFGFYRAAQKAVAELDADTRALLEAYSRGVNDFFARHGQDLHALYDANGLTPETWTPADCIASWWHFGQFFGTDGTRDLLRYRHLTEGSGRPNAVPTPDEAAAVIQRPDVDAAWLAKIRAYLEGHGYTAKDAAAGDDGARFSHAWVVGGQVSGTGAAVLVSDPQTPVTNPSLLYEFHLKGASFDARGVGVAGSPLMLIGFNRQVAWGMTALGADQADLFRLQTDPQRPDQYFFDGRWRPMQVWEEQIRVKGQAPQTLRLRSTHLGPLVTPFAFARPQDGEVALRRVPLDNRPETTLAAGFAMLRATDAEAFRQALASWRFPSVNALWGDAQGRIGYAATAALPLRSPQAPEGGRAAHDGTSSRHDWHGYVPFDFMPQVMDPGRGLLYSGNHRPIGAFYPIDLGNMTGALGHTLRSWRLAQRLDGQQTLSPQDVLDIHFDTVNPARRQIVRLGYHLQERGTQLAPATQKALQYLEDWYQAGAPMDLRVPGAELASRLDLGFRAHNTPLARQYGGGQTGLVAFLRHADTQAEAQKDLPSAEVAYIDALLADAWQQARQAWGDDPARWPEAARAEAGRQKMDYMAGLDGFGSLDAELDLPLPPLFCQDGNTILSQKAQAYTQYVPLHDVDQALSILPPGTSEDPRSPFRQSTLKDWQEAKLHPAPLSPKALKPHIRTRTVLLEP